MVDLRLGIRPVFRAHLYRTRKPTASFTAAPTRPGRHADASIYAGIGPAVSHSCSAVPVRQSSTSRERRCAAPRRHSQTARTVRRHLDHALRQPHATKFALPYSKIFLVRCSFSLGSRSIPITRPPGCIVDFTTTARFYFSMRVALTRRFVSYRRSAPNDARAAADRTKSLAKAQKEAPRKPPSTAPEDAKLKLYSAAASPPTNTGRSTG